VHSVEDVQGLRIRVPEIDSYVKTWEAFGASPTAMAWPDVYMALQTGVIDAQDNAPEHTWSNRTYEVQDYYSVINYTWMGGVLTINLQRWNELPEDVQEIMLEAAREAGEWTFDELSQANVDALDRMEEAGLEVIRDPDSRGFGHRRRVRHGHGPEVRGQDGGLCDPKRENARWTRVLYYAP
jgi:TRAP-type C4-dicarboxylate transport system substrate-binding protein